MLIFEGDRPSDSPYVERVWRYHSDGGGSFLSIAECRSELVVARHEGRVTVTVRGPETMPTRLSYPSDAEWLGIRLKPGAFLPSRPARELVNSGMSLPAATRASFWLDGAVWQLPDYENADTFVAWLVRAGLLVIDPAVPAALRNELTNASLRTVQRRFLQVSGVTRSVARQIERARHATFLLRRGASIADATHEAGYFDQPHLTRSLKRLIGQTPAELLRNGSELSYLYKTEPFATP
ncbi:MAG TPA: helix-turn-helix domain-containing protein [Chloroflexota bacterium]|nr:helix-turn-helix domain-containing protein [Chloroflexota bacterium]